VTIPSVGEAAPDFALSDDRGVEHRLSDQRGKWVVLYFYPTDNSPGCTVEACEFRDANDEILARGAVVWAVSPQGARSKADFRSKFGLPFELLADEDHAVSEAYGAWVEKRNYGKVYWGTARSTFLVDPDGRIARVWPRVKPQGHAAEVLTALDQARGGDDRTGGGRKKSEASPVGGDE
jgi:peroxiredoxin Q/BCP